MENQSLQSVEERLAEAQAVGPTDFECADLRFSLLADVFPPTHFQSTRIFVGLIEYAAGSSFLELGCGAGVMATVAALKGCAPVVASDISDAAVDNTRLNAKRHGVADAVSVRQGDLFDVLRHDECFDTIFWNSNFVLASEEYLRSKPQMRAFCDPGYAAHERFLRDAQRHLTPGGQLLLGFSSQGSADTLRSLVSTHGYDFITVASAHGAGPNPHRYDVLRLLPKSGSSGISVERVGVNEPPRP